MMTAPGTCRVELIHVGAAEDMPVARHICVVDSRYARVPRSCLDCPGSTVPITPAEGFDVSLLLVHDGTCPALAAMIRQENAP